MITELENGGDPEVISKLQRDLYVDDPTTSVKSVDEGINYYEKSKTYMKNGIGFNLRKWATNDPELRSFINEEIKTYDNISNT